MTSIIVNLESNENRLILVPTIQIRIVKHEFYSYYAEPCKNNFSLTSYLHIKTLAIKSKWDEPWTNTTDRNLSFHTLNSCFYSILDVRQKVNRTTSSYNNVAWIVNGYMADLLC